MKKIDNFLLHYDDSSDEELQEDILSDNGQKLKILSYLCVEHQRVKKLPTVKPFLRKLKMVTLICNFFSRQLLFHDDVMLCYKQYKKSSLQCVNVGNQKCASEILEKEFKFWIHKCIDNSVTTFFKDFKFEKSAIIEVILKALHETPEFTDVTERGLKNPRKFLRLLAYTREKNQSPFSKWINQKLEKLKEIMKNKIDESVSEVEKCVPPIAFQQHLLKEDEALENAIDELHEKITNQVINRLQLYRYSDEYNKNDNRKVDKSDVRYIENIKEKLKQNPDDPNVSLLDRLLTKIKLTKTHLLKHIKTETDFRESLKVPFKKLYIKAIIFAICQKSNHPNKWQLSNEIIIYDFCQLYQKDALEPSEIKTSLGNFVPSIFKYHLKNYMETEWGKFKFDFTNRVNIETSFTQFRRPSNIHYTCSYKFSQATQFLAIIKAMNRSSTRAIKNCFKLSDSGRDPYFKNLSFCHTIYPKENCVSPIKFVETISSNAVTNIESRTSLVPAASSYKVILKNINICLQKLSTILPGTFVFVDKDFAWWILLCFHGKSFHYWPKFGKIMNDYSEMIPAEHYGYIELVTEITGLMFVVEPQRNPSALVYGIMILDLMMRDKKFTWKNCFQDHMFPMALKNAVGTARAIVANLQLNFGPAINYYEYVGPMNSDEDLTYAMLEAENCLIRKWESSLKVKPTTVSQYLSELSNLYSDFNKAPLSFEKRIYSQRSYGDNNDCSFLI